MLTTRFDRSERVLRRAGLCDGGAGVDGGGFGVRWGQEGEIVRCREPGGRDDRVIRQVANILHDQNSQEKKFAVHIYIYI